jgi:hypothetical protein
MDVVWTYRGRQITSSDLEVIRALIARHPEASRWQLSNKLCEAWGWVQQNGHPCDLVCRSLMLALHRAKQIELPPVRRVTHNPLARRVPPPRIEVDRTPIRARLRDLGPLRIEQVRRGPSEPLVRSLLEAHHYLGYTQPVGEHLAYLVWAGERPVACLCFSSAPRHLGPRDRYLGWSAEARRKNIHFVAYHGRFLILPWVEVAMLASHLLGCMARRISEDWLGLYGHPVYFLETFVDPERYRGTCYRAANWVSLGLTTGRGKDDLTHRPNRSRKVVFGYPLHKRFRALLSETP